MSIDDDLRPVSNRKDSSDPSPDRMHRPDKAKNRKAAGFAETQVRVRAVQENNERQAIARLARWKSQTLGELRARAQTTSHDSPHPPSGHIVHRHKFRARNVNNNSTKQIGMVL